MEGQGIDTANLILNIVSSGLQTFQAIALAYIAVRWGRQDGGSR